jgi:hypothetical protein
VFKAQCLTIVFIMLIHTMILVHYSWRISDASLPKIRTFVTISLVHSLASFPAFLRNDRHEKHLKSPLKLHAPK